MFKCPKCGKNLVVKVEKNGVGGGGNTNVRVVVTDRKGKSLKTSSSLTNKLKIVYYELNASKRTL